MQLTILTNSTYAADLADATPHLFQPSQTRSIYRLHVKRCWWPCRRNPTSTTFSLVFNRRGCGDDIPTPQPPPQSPRMRSVPHLNYAIALPLPPPASTWFSAQLLCCDTAPISVWVTYLSFVADCWPPPFAVESEGRWRRWRGYWPTPFDNLILKVPSEEFTIRLLL